MRGMTLPWILKMEAFTQFGKYQILDRIAFGGMAELFRARIQGEQGFQKLVAVKKMHAHFSIEPEVVEAFIEEAKLAAFLQHPNIVQIYDFGCRDDAYFIVMEYLQGKDLRTLTTALADHKRPLGVENSLAVAASICSGLEYAHRLSDMAGQPLHIVHRDISPQNIFVTYAGQVKILDFGIAKATDRRGDTTEAGVLKGKVAYMSPEQAQGKIIDHRSDIFAVGIILYELLTGRRLYHGNTMEILRRAQTGEFAPLEECLPDLSPELRHVFQGLLAVRPADRFPDCAVALAAIEECLGDLSSRSIERHLGDLVSDLFAEDKMAEKTQLRDLMAGQALPDTVEPPDIDPGSDPVPSKGAFRYHPFASPSKTMRKPGWRWLRLGLAGFLVVAFFFIWVRWHIPGKNQGQSLEAFQARNFKETAVAIGAEQETVLQGPGSLAPDLLPLEQQARSLMASEPQKAVDLWRQVIEGAPDNIRANFNLGLVLLRLEDYPQAIHAFERVLALDDRMTDAHFNLGFAYAKMGRYDEATLQYGRVVDQAPAYLDEVLFNLAIIQDFQGDRQAAAHSLHGALRYNPHNVRAISYLARMEGRFSSPP